MKFHFQHNCLEDFEYFSESEWWHQKGPYIAAAHANLNSGNDCFTFVESDKLLAVGWIGTRQSTARFSYVKQTLAFRELSVATLFSAYVHPCGRRRGIYRDLLQARLRWAYENTSTDLVLCAEEGDNTGAIESHRRLGLEPVCKFTSTTRLGSKRCHAQHLVNQLSIRLVPDGENHWRLQRDSQ